MCTCKLNVLFHTIEWMIEKNYSNKILLTYFLILGFLSLIFHYRLFKTSSLKILKINN